ncbi:MAG: PfkB family carbohydrate kinase [Treponema sp.]|nr:PfkB family carbohydrate kinase [Treponema sp.]MCL2237484.1 PfkB family carbohydrate kinase [Treponema sp.]
MFLSICLNPTLQKTLRFPLLALGEVNRTASHRLDASGKGINVTRVLTQLGKEAIHLTHLGGVMRPLILSLCEQDGLNVEWVESDSQIRFCYTVINKNDESVTELVEESQPVTAGTEERLMEKFNEIITRFDAHNTIIISGTKAAGYSDAAIPAMVQKAKEKGLCIILDIKGKDLIESLKYEPDIIKPNLDEFKQTFGLDADNFDLHGIVLELAHKHKCRIVLTNGSREIIAADSNEIYKFDVAAHDTSAIQNTTGCGDAFTAGLAAALNNKIYIGKEDFNAAVNEGIRCGALNAAFERPGVISCDK